jgi:hypothetical protein
MDSKITEADLAKMSPLLADFRTKAKELFRAAKNGSASEINTREALRKLHSHTEESLRSLFGKDKATIISEELLKRGGQIQRVVAR